MARLLVHRMVHKADRPGGGPEWACPLCPQQVVYWSINHKVIVKGRSVALHVRPARWSPDDKQADTPVTARTVGQRGARWEHGIFVGGIPSARQGAPD
jgi:hypothetical protein